VLSAGSGQPGSAQTKLPAQNGVHLLGRITHLCRPLLKFSTAVRETSHVKLVHTEFGKNCHPIAIKIWTSLAEHYETRSSHDP